MTSAERLYRLTNSQSKTSSYKYKLQCQDKITSDKTTTDDWLQLTKRFNHDSQDIKIFEALLEKKKHVVVKVGLSKNLFIEYDIGFNLSSLKLPTFLSFYCHFKCMDSFDKISTGSRLCGNNKDEISVLVMPFISGGQIDKFKWTRDNVDVYKSVLKHVICSLLYAFETLSFVHNDMHFGNILLKKTKKASIQYGDWSLPVVKGYIPVIMDFERSKLPCPQYHEQYTPVYKDISRVLSLATAGIDVQLDIDTSLVRKYISQETPITKKVYEELCRYIDTRKITHVFSELERTI